MGLKVLILEDEHDMLEGLKNFFTAMGHNVFAALRGDEAINILEKEHPDVALCDLHLKDSPVTGLDVVKKISQDYRDTKVIIMTGFGADEDVRAACMKHNPYLFLDKPLDLIKIQNTLLEIEKSRVK